MIPTELLAWAKRQVEIHPIANDAHVILIGPPSVTLGELRAWIADNNADIPNGLLRIHPSGSITIPAGVKVADLLKAFAK